MPSEKQAEANRKNALRSTGPKTPRGKAIAKMNALKHGLLSQEVLVAGERAKDLEELGERLRAELRPAGELEQILVDRIVSAVWRLKRCLRIEAAVIEHEEEDGERHEYLYPPVTGLRPTPTQVRLARASSVASDGERLERLLRYETSIERQIYKALQQLERLRQVRAGPLRMPGRIIEVETIPPPALPAPEPGKDSESENGFVR